MVIVNNINTTIIIISSIVVLILIFIISSLIRQSEIENIVNGFDASCTREAYGAFISEGGPDFQGFW